MSRNRFVQPETVRLPISDGDFIDVKKRLTHGEREDFFATIAPFDFDGRSKLDRHLLRTTRLVTWIVGWSFMNDGKPVPMSPDLSLEERMSTIRGLDTETFDEVHAAVLAHEDAQNLASAERKNDLPGADKLSATSPSPSAGTSPTNTSAT